MKRILQLALLTAVTFLSTSAHAYIYNESDVLLVFRKTGFNDVEFDIGSISNYLGKANGTVITVTNNTGLTNGWNFGLTRSNYNNSLSGVNFLLIAATSLSDSVKRVWATDVDPNDVPLEVTPSTRTTTSLRPDMPHSSGSPIRLRSMPWTRMAIALSCTGLSVRFRCRVTVIAFASFLIGAR